VSRLSVSITSVQVLLPVRMCCEGLGTLRRELEDASCNELENERGLTSLGTT
jgi:hypothetical protein